ncbi:hypothetical protein D4764_09G0000030 [Takifugu flavidus]|uniref:ribonuclease H n=1 Tax=Takifugu flavidus TaxID=433684 RepID=A0A5C6MII9_9TELE|nr:hypothetical protein D4764_09G0000030 [Takifugu flavidus]
MEPADVPSEPAPQRALERERRPPAYLTDYVVATLPPEGQTHTTQQALSSQRSRSGRTCSSQKSCDSRSTRSSRSSSSRFPSNVLSELETAQLEERVKQMELEELQQRLEEDNQIEHERLRLQSQAREAQQLQEEAIRTQETLTRQLESRRQLKKRANQLEIAKMVTSLLKEKAQDPGGARSSPCPSDHSEARQPVPQPAAPHATPPPAPVTLPSASQHAVLPPAAQTSLQAPHVAPPSTPYPSLPPLPHPALPPVSLPCSSAPVNYYSAPISYPVHPAQYLPSSAAFTCPVKAEPCSTTALPQLQTADVFPLSATSYGIPKPMIPFFESGKESDFALLRMALDNLLNSHLHLSEQYKYQVLLGHLKLPSALQLAKAYMHDPRPYTAAMQALQDKYGQPRQLVQSELGAILNAPALKFGDSEAFDAFALSIQTLVGMLRTLEGQNGYELRCGSHVDRLLGKMPPSYRDGFVEYCLNQGILRTGTDQTYTLPDLSVWLQMKSQAKRIAGRAASLYNFEAPKPPKKDQRAFNKSKEKSTAFLLTASDNQDLKGRPAPMKFSSKPKPYCPHCDNKEHFLNACAEFKKLNTEQIVRWIRDGQRCWKCGRSHKPEGPCNTCKEQHLTVLHNAVQQTQKSVLMVTAPTTKVYLDRPNRSPKVMLKVVKVLLHAGDRVLETYAVLDDGSERSIILPQAVQRLNLTAQPETLTVRTVHQEVVQLQGASVTLYVSSLLKPEERYHIHHAFTSENLGLSEHSYPVRSLQQKYKHLRNLPLPPVEHAQPLLLIGSDLPHLLTPIEPVRTGPPGGPIAVHTQLGWSLQGPTNIDQVPASEQQCLFTVTDSPTCELFKNVERLWQIDTLPYTSKKQICYTVASSCQLPTTLQAPMETVLSSLRSTERRLAKDPQRAEAYCQEIRELERMGYVAVVPPEYPVAVSGDIKGMFHQIRLLPADKPVLRFIWRDMKRTEEPKIYEWQVLPFGTTCSPCCAIYALQRHVQNTSESNSDLIDIVEQSFYVDNCLHSTHSKEEAKDIVDRLRHLLHTGGFEIRQWASNVPAVIEHLPSNIRSESSELWLSQYSTDLQEPTLGLRWDCIHDTLKYKHRPVERTEPTLRNVYRVLACQYDPLGYIVPFTTRAKILVQDLWKAQIGWDDPIQPQSLRDRWLTWEREIPDLIQMEIPRCYAPVSADSSTSIRDLHIFCDASERAYGSVAYLRTEDAQKQVHVSFVLARSRVAPKKQLSMPRLELSAALTGAQLASVLQTELALPIGTIILWSDSTTVLHWITSESCQYKVFVGTRVAEIQSLTDVSNWRYVDTANNPADDITRGKTLKELSRPHRWHQGPAFLRQTEDHWPTSPSSYLEADDSELKKSSFCGHVTVDSCPQLPEVSMFSTWKELMQATAQLESFPEEVKALITDRPLPTSSRLGSLSPEYDKDTGLIRVGGRLRRAEQLELDTIHPVLLDPKHPLTNLIIQDFDETLLHPGPERVLAELRRRFWILRGREAVKRQQSRCMQCQAWRANPSVPKMADLPPARLRLYKPPFYSTGVDCFGPFTVKIGRRTEKRWGIVFKCMTTRCVHLDLLEGLDTDAFLMSLRRFVARRGKPFELLSDNGTNFVGGARELREAFETMAPHLKEQLAKQKIEFCFNPPSAPHFGGAWEREVRSVKTALKVVLKEQTVPETVLQTVLVEVEGILNAKPLGYVSSDLADPDPITPSILLMGRYDASLPQVIYDSNDTLGIADGGTAKFLSIASGPDSSVTTCLVYRRDRSGREMANILNQSSGAYCDPKLRVLLWIGVAPTPGLCLEGLPLIWS